MNILRCSFFVLLLQFSAVLFAQQPVPPLNGRVNDLTSTLNASQIKKLESLLGNYESQKGVQIAVLVVPTTEPETIDAYGIRVADAWKIGRKGIDDGVILIVAKNDRRLRIEVGYGLEGAIPDAVAKRIISEYITPQFKKGHFYAGISAGLEQITKRIDGEPLPPSSPKANKKSNDNDWTGLLFGGFILVVVLGGILRNIFGRLFGAILTGGLAALAAWVFVGFLLAAVAGLFGFFFSLVGGSVMRSGLLHTGGFYGGRSSGGGFGGFSGGGGGFGGGGSSGGW